jgi:GntR family transcriptional regulator
MMRYNDMTNVEAEVEQALKRITDAIDRELTVPVSVQLRGALEFGIASGELPIGARLPSVRAFAARLGISPVTVSSVFGALQQAGHIEGRVGSGTFVSDSGNQRPVARMRELERKVAELVEFARECGLGPAELAMRVSLSTPRRRRSVRLLMVGNFHDATDAYADTLRPHLPEGDTIRSAILDDLQDDPPRDVDLVVAPRTLLVRARALFPGIDTVGLTLIPNEATRVALASMRPEDRIVAYSYFPSFVTIMKAGVIRFAPHVMDLTMVVRGDDDADARIGAADVLIYATGAEYLLDGLRPNQTAFEYRHTPDGKAIQSELLPAVEACRARLTRSKESMT